MAESIHGTHLSEQGGLTITFNNLDEPAMKTLGNALGALAQGLYESGWNLQAEPISGKSVLFVCMEGGMGSGKSTLSAAMLENNADAEDACHDRKLITVPITHDIGPTRDIIVWESQWSQVTGQQNRMRDCWLTEPFNDNPYATKYNVPERLLPGVEILEHSKLVPDNLRGLTVKIEGRDQQKRSVSVSLPHVTDERPPLSWEAFKRETEGLLLSF